MSDFKHHFYFLLCAKPVKESEISMSVLNQLLSRMDQKKNFVFIALRSMENESRKAGDRSMERCLNGCVKSLKATSKIVNQLEDLEGLQGFTKAMVQRIKDRFEKGSMRCECNKMCKSLEDLENHIKNFHQKKKPSKKTKRSSTHKKEADISGVKLPEKGTAAFAVLMALNGENIILSKKELQQEAQKFTKENLSMSGNKLDVFKTTWHQIEALVMSGLLKKVGTPVQYSLTSKGLGALVEWSKKDARLNLYREIPLIHRADFGKNQVICRILGDGSCLYGCASYFVNEIEDKEETKELRRRAHKFLKDTWADLGQDEDHAILFPQEFIIAGEASKVTLNSASDWLQFLQTEQSLKVYTEFELETQNLANYLNLTIKIFNFNSSVSYMNTYTPTPEIAVLSPYNDLLGPYSINRTMLVYHEIDSHFEMIVNHR